MPLSIINIIIGATVLFLLFNIKALREYRVVSLLYIVILNFIAELTVYFINKSGFIGGSSWFYNFTLPIELFLYCFLFRRLFINTRFRKGLAAASFLMIVLFVMHYFRGNSFYDFNAALYICLSLFILLCVLYFFIKLFVKDYFQINPLKQFYFWLSSGLLICYLGGFMFLTNAYQLFTTNRMLYNNLKELNLILNIFLYLCIIIAVICLRKFKTSQIQSL